MKAQTLRGLRDLEYMQLRETYARVSQQITAYRLRGKSTRHLEVAARNICALLNDRPMASVPARALMGVRGSGFGTVGNTSRG